MLLEILTSVTTLGEITAVSMQWLDIQKQCKNVRKDNWCDGKRKKLAIYNVHGHTKHCQQHKSQHGYDECNKSYMPQTYFYFYNSYVAAM